MLKDKPILIVEDNVFRALDLSSAVEDLEGRVVGPAGSVVEALSLLRSEPIVAAIVDCQLVDAEVTDVVMQLAERGIPFVVQTGTGLPRALRDLVPNAPVLTKPIPAKTVVGRLVDEIAKTATAAAGKPEATAPAL